MSHTHWGSSGLFFSHAAGNIPVFTAAYKAIRIGFFLCAFCVTVTLWFFHWLCIADFTYISARCACCCGNITAASVMFMLAVQFFCDTAAFLAALMGAGVSFIFRVFGGNNAVGIAILRMLVNAVRHKPIAVVRVARGYRDFPPQPQYIRIPRYAPYGARKAPPVLTLS